MTKLENYLMIFSQLLIKKYMVIINIINNFLAFWPSYCIYIKAISFTILNQRRLPTGTAVVGIEKDIIS